MYFPQSIHLSANIALKQISSQCNRGDSCLFDHEEHAQCNGFRAKEDKRSTKYKLDRNNTRSKQISIPKKQSISVVFNYSVVR